MDDRKLDDLLRGVTPPKPDGALMGRVMEDAVREAARVGWRNLGAALWPFGPVWQPVSALMLVAVMGVSLAPQTTGSDQELAFANVDFNMIVLGTGFEPDIEWDTQNKEIGE